MKMPDYTQLYCQNKKNVDAERVKQLHDYKNDKTTFVVFVFYDIK